MNTTSGELAGWTVETLRLNIQQQIDDMRRMLDERYGTQTRAIDAAFLAQQTAMQTALTAAERAVQTALMAAEKSNDKAENAAEARFASLVEKLDAETARTTSQLNEIASRLDVSQGRYVAYAGSAAIFGGTIVAIVMKIFAA